MALAYHAANAMSILLFLGYGLFCLFSDGMVEEFDRFGLSRFRRLTGSLEVLGATGLIAGYAYPILTPLSAGGLATLMLLGLAVRIKVRDHPFEMVPAAFLLVINVFIAFRALQG